MKKIKFSIIVPIYNIELYVDKCINSILNQTYSNFEIIAVNDGSTDNSIKVLESINDSRLSIFTKINGGLSSARNYGLKKATGDYIWFLDGDDYIENNSLEILEKIISKEQSEVVCFLFYKDYVSYKVVSKDRIEWGKKELYPLITVSACTKVYNLSFFKKNNFKFKEGILFEDLEIVPDIMTSTSKVSFCKDALYNYVQREGSIIRSNVAFKPNRDDRFIALKSLFKRFKDKNKYDLYQEQLNYLAIRHLVNIFTEELFKYNKKIYLERFNNINKFLDNLKNIDNNKFLLTSPRGSIIYYRLFRLKKYFLCKLLIKIKKIIKK